MTGSKPAVCAGCLILFIINCKLEEMYFDFLYF